MNNEELIQRFKNQRTDKFTIVLNDNELHLFRNSENICRMFCTDENLSVVYIAVIKHDKDFNDELQQFKTVHYHVVIQVGCVCRIGTMINKIMDLFHCNENQITIDKCNSLCMQSRYLCHLDDFDKAKYLQCDVATNDKDVLDRYFNLVIVRDLHDLIAVCQRYYYDLEQIMVHVAHYDKWRKYINDLIINYNRKRV